MAFSSTCSSDQELLALKSLAHRFCIKRSQVSEFFDKIHVPARILLDVLFRVFRFSKASFNAVTPSFIHSKTLLQSWQRGVQNIAMAIIFVISHTKLNINTEILCQNKGVTILTLLRKTEKYSPILLTCFR